GAGIAREFKKRFPDMFRDYAKACKRQSIRIEGVFGIEIGEKTKILEVMEIWDWKPHLWKTNYRGKDIIILNFPSKIYWDLPSHLKIIEAGLKWIRGNLNTLSEELGRSVKKLALPQIGVGYGGLKWEDVKKLIEEYLSGLRDVEVELYLNYTKQEKQKETGVAKRRQKSRKKGKIDYFQSTLDMQKS
ncbi:MAG: hypothetical protein QXQ38_02520, partial [Archaeoglobaceae archaeon]